MSIDNTPLDSGKRKSISMLLAAVPGLGAVGGHKYYLGQYRKGVVFTVLTLSSAFLFIPVVILQLIAWGTAIHYGTMKNRDFHERVIRGRGDHLVGNEINEHAQSGPTVLAETDAYYDFGELSSSFGGTNKGPLYVTDEELILGYSRTVPGGDVSRSIFEVLYGGAVRGLGRAIPGLGLVIAGVRWISAKLWRASESSPSVVQARAQNQSVVVPLHEIESVDNQLISDDEHHLRVGVDERHDELWIAPGSSPSAAGDPDETEQIKETLGEAVTAAKEQAKIETEDTIYCPHCGQENLSDSNFCQDCGEQLTVENPNKDDTSQGEQVSEPDAEVTQTKQNQDS